MDNTHDDNITPPHGEPSTSPFIVTLDSWQYFRYQTHQIEIHAPDGRHLETVGAAISNEISENSVVHLREQLALVGCLLGNVNDSVNLSIPAVLGLTELFSRMEEVWNKVK